MAASSKSYMREFLVSARSPVRKSFARPRKQKQRNRKGGFRWTGSLSFEAIGFCNRARKSAARLRKQKQQRSKGGFRWIGGYQ